MESGQVYVRHITWGTRKWIFVRDVKRWFARTAQQLVGSVTLEVWCCSEQINILWTPSPTTKKKKNAEMLRTPQWFNPQELLGSHIWALDFPCPKWPCRVRGGAIIWFVMKKAWASASVISEARYGVSEVFSITVFFECWLLFPEVMTQIWVAIQSGDHIHPKLN